jgi:hypothetical protein
LNRGLPEKEIGISHQGELPELRKAFVRLLIKMGLVATAVKVTSIHSVDSASLHQLFSPRIVKNPTLAVAR